MGTVYFCDVGCANTSIIVSGLDFFIIDIKDEISKFSRRLPGHKRIKALFISHQHYDHFDGMRYLLDNNYTAENLICSPYSRRNQDNSVQYDEWQLFDAYLKLYRQESFQKPWWEISGFKFWMLAPCQEIASEATRELHDACLVFKVDLGQRSCVFTGDASDKSLNWVAKNTNNFCNDILHASHHGSLNGADLDFIKKSSAKHTVISTKSGVYENVPHPTALSRYNDNSGKVYRTDLDGELSVTF